MSATLEDELEWAKGKQIFLATRIDDLSISMLSHFVVPTAASVVLQLFARQVGTRPGLDLDVLLIQFRNFGFLDQVDEYRLKITLEGAPLLKERNKNEQVRLSVEAYLSPGATANVQ